MTFIQYQTAWLLADHFSHAWTRFFGPDDWSEELTPEAIREVVNRKLGPEFLVLCRAPEVCEDERVHHLDCSRRIEWFVGKNGAVDVLVHRPERAAVLTFLVTPTHEVREVKDHASDYLDETLLLPQVWAGNEVLQVLLGGDPHELHPALEDAMEWAWWAQKRLIHDRVVDLIKACADLSDPATFFPRGEKWRSRLNTFKEDEQE